MGRRLSEKQKKALLTAGITAAVYISFKYILPLVLPFLLAYWTALLIRPVTRGLHKRLYLKEGIWASLCVAVLFGALFAGLYFLGRLFLSELALAVRRLPVYMKYLWGWLDEVCCRCDSTLGFARGTSMEFLYTQCGHILGSLQARAGTYVMDNSVTALRWIIQAGAVITIISIGSVLMVTSMDRIRRYRSISVFRQEYTAITGCLSRIGKAFFRAQLLIMLLTSLICGAGLFLLGNSYALLLGVLIGILDALPVFGTGTVLIPWAIVSAILGNWPYAAGLSLLYGSCYFLREILEARLMGGNMGIPPLEMLMSMYIGLLPFGVSVFILGPFGFMVIRELVELYGGKGSRFI